MYPRHRHVPEYNDFFCILLYVNIPFISGQRGSCLDVGGEVG